jgi:hypothetical protein
VCWCVSGGVERSEDFKSLAEGWRSVPSFIISMHSSSYKAMRMATYDSILDRVSVPSEYLALKLGGTTPPNNPAVWIPSTSASLVISPR